MRMPGIIIAEQLGLSRDNVATFKKWADSMLGASRAPIATEEEVTANAKIELEAQLFLADVFEDRRENPKEDLMSAMVHAHGDDEEPIMMDDDNEIVEERPQPKKESLGPSLLAKVESELPAKVAEIKEKE